MRSDTPPPSHPRPILCSVGVFFELHLPVKMGNQPTVIPDTTGPRGAGQPIRTAEGAILGEPHAYEYKARGVDQSELSANFIVSADGVIAGRPEMLVNPIQRAVRETVEPREDADGEHWADIYPLAPALPSSEFSRGDRLILTRLAITWYHIPNVDYELRVRLHTTAPCADIIESPQPLPPSPTESPPPPPPPLPPSSSLPLQPTLSTIDPMIPPQPEPEPEGHEPSPLPPVTIYPPLPPPSQQRVSSKKAVATGKRQMAFLPYDRESPRILATEQTLGGLDEHGEAGERERSVSCVMVDVSHVCPPRPGVTFEDSPSSLGDNVVKSVSEHLRNKFMGDLRLLLSMERQLLGSHIPRVDGETATEFPMYHPMIFVVNTYKLAGMSQFRRLELASVSTALPPSVPTSSAMGVVEPRLVRYWYAVPLELVKTVAKTLRERIYDRVKYVMPWDVCLSVCLCRRDGTRFEEDTTRTVASFQLSVQWIRVSDSRDVTISACPVSQAGFR